MNFWSIPSEFDEKFEKKIDEKLKKCEYKEAFQKTDFEV